MKNRRLLVAGFLTAFLSACGSGTVDDAEPPLETAESELISCGPLCPPGYTQTGFACSTACFGNCPNAVSCSPTPTTAAVWGTPQTVSVPAGGLATSRICWRTSGLRYPVWIKVSANGAPEQLFTKESNAGQHCENAPWIQANSTYVFSIRTAKTGGAILTSSTVVGVPAP